MLALMAPSADSECDRIGRGIFERSAASPQMVQTLFDMVLDTDVRDLLPSIRVPTLVLHRPRGVHSRRGRALHGRAHPGRAAGRVAGDGPHAFLRRRRQLCGGDRRVPDRRPSGARIRSHPHDRDVHRHRRLNVRAGLHTGECELIGDDIGGMAVNIGARISALAGADEVVVSSTVKDLVVGSGISFSDRGARELMGVPGDWRLFAVDQIAGARHPRPRQRAANARSRSGRSTIKAARIARQRGGNEHGRQ